MLFFNISKYIQRKEKKKNFHIILMICLCPLFDNIDQILFKSLYMYFALNFHCYILFKRHMLHMFIVNNEIVI
jgi:hypothetical protein